MLGWIVEGFWNWEMSTKILPLLKFDWNKFYKNIVFEKVLNLDDVTLIPFKKADVIKLLFILDAIMFGGYDILITDFSGIVKVELISISAAPKLFITIDLGEILKASVFPAIAR